MTGLATFIQEKIPVLSNRSCMLHTEVFDHDYLTTDGTEHTDCPALAETGIANLRYLWKQEQANRIILWK